MTTHQESADAEPAAEHILQLSDTPDSRGTAVSAFLFAGWARGERLVVAAKSRHWRAIRAARLEALWNGLTTRHRFQLLCGYSAAHFAGTARTNTLQHLCKLHTRIQRGGSDLMGSWLYDRWQAVDRARQARPD